MGCSRSSRARIGTQGTLRSKGEASMSKGTRHRNIRIPDDLWQQALTLARSRGEHLSDIIRAALTDYIKQQGEK